MDFCITSQARLFFTSSIGVLTGILIFHTYCVLDINSLELAMPPEIAPPPEAPIPPVFAFSNGYMQSKWVSEQILDAAHRYSGLKYLNIRVGQLTGAINGAWNVKEWFPSMIQASKILGCIPSDHRVRHHFILRTQDVNCHIIITEYFLDLCIPCSSHDCGFCQQWINS